jgi:hypothetical protein
MTRPASLASCTKRLIGADSGLATEMTRCAATILPLPMLINFMDIDIPFGLYSDHIRPYIPPSDRIAKLMEFRYGGILVQASLLIRCSGSVL